MIELTESHYRDLCHAGRVQAELSTLADRRRSALLMFWLFLIVGLGLAALSFWIAWTNDQLILGTILASVVAIVGMGTATVPIARVGRNLKLPVLETLAGQVGLTYVPSGFAPPVYEEAKGSLFGARLDHQYCSDLFQGTDAEGCRFAIYEAYITRNSGRMMRNAFTGQIYAFQRRRRSGGPIVVMPDWGVASFLSPAAGIERVKFDSDPEFERLFEVHAGHPHEALAFLGAEARRKFLEWRKSGRIMAWIGPEDILVGIVGKDRFEAGSMFRGRSGEERVRRMFDDLCASLATLRDLKASLDGGP
jgi:hypothetical protein